MIRRAIPLWQRAQASFEARFGAAAAARLRAMPAAAVATVETSTDIRAARTLLLRLLAAGDSG